MTYTEDRLAYVGRRAYELAQTGEHEDFASIEQAIIDEGFDEWVAWLERPGVIESLNQICVSARRPDAVF